ncbi:hypothetical protein [Streptomyces sp. LaBMicrA B280]|uniref:hypothetical protein n=1 Tax=Streptomyces sp. LaBMicrA B280 TaxID=3391001 RepID=UPI003BA5B60B
MNGGVPGHEIAHGGELLFRGGEAGLDRGDLAKPSLLLGLLEPVVQVRVDLLQAGHLLEIGPQDGAADAGVFMDAGGAEVTCADAEGDLPQLEVGQEVLPFLRGGLAVLLPGSQRPAAGDEGPVVVDDVLGIDR